MHKQNRDGDVALVLNAAGLGTVNGNDMSNDEFYGAKFIIDVTAISGTTPTAQFTIQGKDPLSGKYFTILQSASISTVSTVVLTIFPGATASANVAVNDFLPHSFRVICVVGGTTPSVTATVAVSFQA